MINFTKEELNNEIWRNLPEGYKISSLGRFRYPNGRLAVSQTDGYQYVYFNKKRIPLHRLVAETFIPNPEGKEYVNHINSIKYDNRISNLEWVSARENNIHAIKYGNRKAIVKSEEKIIKLFKSGCSIEEIAESLNFTNETIRSFLSKRGLIKTTKKQFSDSEITTMIKMRQSGLSYTKISRNFHVTPQTIMKTCADFFISKLPPE